MPRQRLMEENWSDQELAAAVRGYSFILACEETGEEYSKSHVICELQSGALGARSRSAIEYGMRNISFVMTALDRKWIRGYIPARNVGWRVAERIHSMIEAEERAKRLSFEEDDGVSAGVPRLPPTTPEISRRMSAVRQRDTGPELEVRRAVHALGYRYRTHAKDLPGCPDIVFRGRKKVIFVHGCYWHRHEGCPHATTPKTNTDFWQRKFKENVRRDAAAIEELKRLGWFILLVWSCEVGYKSALLPRLKRFLGEPTQQRQRAARNQGGRTGAPSQPAEEGGRA